jgi:hypothetical protein
VRLPSPIAHRPRLAAAITATAIALIIIVVVLVIALPGGGKHRTVTPPPGGGPEAITVSGNQLLRGGRPFVPRGVTLVGELSPTSTGTAGEAQTHYGPAELSAARSWGVDTLRFQVSQPGLDPQDPAYSTAYVDRVKAAVQLARQHGFTVIVSVQDQGFGGGTRHPLPSGATLRDWTTLTSLFNADRGVIYEMFNEPQNADTTDGWNSWENGAPAAANQGDPAVGMAQVLSHIRATGSQNVVLADGARFAQSLDGIPRLHDPTGQLGYAIHPYLAGRLLQPSRWDTLFGNAADEVPVVATEWNATSSAATCHDQWPQLAPELVSYLLNKHIGIVGWAFDIPGTLVTDFSWQPTTFDNFTCGVAGAGAGSLLRNAFLSGSVSG